MSQIRVFQCPACHEYIATDAKSCRFCFTPVDAQTAQLAADAQEIENKKYRQKQYAKHMLIGTGIFALGFVITLGTFAVAVVKGGGYYVITHGLMLAGAGDFLYGLVGLLGEITSRK
jgi:hypothetical protein